MEGSTDSFSSVGSGSSIHSGTTMSSVGGMALGMPYHIRVMIPCYKEDFEIVQKTLNAIREAALPSGAGSCLMARIQLLVPRAEPRERYLLLVDWLCTSEHSLCCQLCMMEGINLQ